MSGFLIFGQALDSGPGVPINQTLPSINNITPKVGDVLTADAGGWFPNPSGYTFQWLRSEFPISGETNDTYTLTSDDIGQVMSIVVVAHNDAGDSAPATSAETFPVVSAPINTVPPQINSSGDINSPIAGDIFTVFDTGSWSGAPSGFTYQWSFSISGDAFGEINQSYTVGGLHAGNSLLCIVTATNATGSNSANSNSSGIFAD